MKKNILFCFLLSIILVSVSGCNEEEKDLGNTYIEGQDYQYMYEDESAFVTNQAKGENGYFLATNHCIYYMDMEKKTAFPLCNKVNCLHMEEPDQELRTECFAHLPGEDFLQIQYYNGNLYTIINDEKSDERILYKIAEDGSRREAIKKWKEEGITEWITHRGYLYYFTTFNKAETDGKIQQVYRVNRISLENTKKEEVLYEIDGDIVNPNLNTLRAYGNYIYFYTMGYKIDDATKLSDDNYYNYLAEDMLAYNIQNKEITTIKVDEKGLVTRIRFLKDKLLLLPEYRDPSDEKLGKEGKTYLADLDGSNAEVFITEQNSSQYVYHSDGNYVYQSNEYLIYFGETKEPQIYVVFDTDGNKIDSFGMPFTGTGAFELGDEKYMFFTFREQEQFRIVYAEKEEIGSLQGKNLPTHVLYQGKVVEE